MSKPLYIKTKLLELLGEFPRTHSLVTLLRELSRVFKGEEVERFRKENIGMLTKLSDVYITSRYLFTREQQRYIKLDDKTAAKINNAIDALKENLFYGRNIKRLRGQLEGKYRLRVGDYRIIYRIEEEGKVVIIEDIRRRGRAY